MSLWIDERLLEEIVRRIVAVADPGRIILYGSAATGQMTEESDVDLLVLEDGPPPSPWKERSRIREALQDLGHPFDVLVMATERFEETKDVIGGMAFAPHKYGKVIYARPGAQRAKGGPPSARSREQVKRELRDQWIAKAESNLAAARHLLSEALPYPDVIGLHARFAAEQCLKAFLVHHQIEFTKINDLRQLLDLIAATDPNLAESLHDAVELNRYDLDTDHPDLSRKDSQRAIALAAKAQDAITSALRLT